MLKIYFGEMDGAIFNTDIYFKNVYENDWITNSLAKEMILDVDRSKVISGGVIDSPVLGMIPPTRLSGGVKTLLLIQHLPEKVFNASTCGDNCAKWILFMAKKKDITINLHHIMDFGDEPFQIELLNIGEIVHGMKELVHSAWKFI